MPLHSIGSGTISFGLVSIPIKMYSAATSAGVSFNQLHQKCGGRIRQQLICPTCNEVVERTALVKGYEFAKDQYVQFTEDELKALEGEAMKKGGRVALAKYVMRGKENLVLIRAAQEGLMLHTMYYADEVRDFGEVEKGEDAKLKPGELELAERLVKELTNESFRPEQYTDEYRTRVLEVVESKVEGREVTSLAPQAQRAQVIDLMEALKQSLGKRGSGAEDASTKKAATLQKKPATRARQKAEPAPREKKV